MAMAVGCRRFIEYDKKEDIPLILREIGPKEPWINIGGGSNLLFTRDFEGTVLHSRILGREVTGQSGEEIGLRVGAGETLDEVVQWACERGWSGLENLSLIPGEMGAAAVQNVGAYGTEIKDVIASVEAYDTQNGEFVTIPVEDCGYGYRQSRFKRERGRFIIHAVNISLSKRFTPNLGYPGLRDLQGINTPMDVRNAVMALRDSKLPRPEEVPSAGSFFMNPVIAAERFAGLQAKYPSVPHYKMDDGGVKVPAAWLIDQSGLKGARVGGAKVWERQPLVITNPERRATPGDVLALEKRIVEAVRERFGITLHPEVEHIGIGPQTPETGASRWLR